MKMKTLQDYKTEKQNKAFEKAGAFFAFSQKQFSQSEKDGEKYVSLGGGLICIDGREEELVNSLKEIHENAIKEDLEENGRDGVIERELLNHEIFYTYDIEQTVEALEDYGITEDEVNNVWKKIRNDPSFDAYH